MHEHLGLYLPVSANSPPTPPATQSSGPSAGSSSSIPSSATHRTASSSGVESSRPSSQSGTVVPQHAPQQHPAQTAVPNAPIQQGIQRNAQQHAAQPPAPATQGQPALAPADEIAALQARIAELERGNAHGNHTPARAAPPHQALVADPAAIDRVQANLAAAKDEPKKPSLPALRPGHKVSALSLRKSSAHFLVYHWVALPHPVSISSSIIPTVRVTRFRFWHRAVHSGAYRSKFCCLFLPSSICPI